MWAYEKQHGLTQTDYNEIIWMTKSVLLCASQKKKENKTLRHDPNPVLTDLTKHRAKFQKEKKHGELMCQSDGKWIEDLTCSHTDGVGGLF